MAAYADTHVLVRKATVDDRTETSFSVLRDDSDRVCEIAAMLDLDVAVARTLVDDAAADIAEAAADAAAAQAALSADLGAAGKGGAPAGWQQGSVLVDELAAGLDGGVAAPASDRASPASS